MHIPDGYLSPATCAALYVAAAPFWYVALQRLKRFLTTRLVPLISVFAAFSFVIMMFNLPLPGGTTGHAVGMGIATIVLGPWGSALAVSVALLIQALFFGDGGITALGANCFNMAIVGSFVTYVVYRAVSGRAPLTSGRRVFAAGLAGYVGLIVAAMLTAIELGIQPALFTDASGAPLYAPYPLSVALPAMAIGHLTIAGMAELFVTAGVVAYLQRANPSLLALTAPGVPGDDAEASVAKSGGWRGTRALWLGMALLMILSPLGLLAAGTAWGEWAPEDFSDPTARLEIQQGSINQAPPLTAPQGLETLSSLWTPLIPDYAPAWMHNETFGYIMSALIGSGLIILTFFLISWIVQAVRGGRGADPDPSVGSP